MAQKPSRISRAVLAPVALATLVAGCSTLPQALDQGEQKQLAAADRRAS